MGIYLPVGVTALIVVGACIGYFYNRWAERARRTPASPSAWAC